MSTPNELRCKSCEAVIDVSSAVDGVVKCKFCHNVYTLPKEGASEAILNFLRIGEHDLDTAKFDDAYAAYAKAAQLDETEPEAYFGMALAEFKVQELKDIVNKRTQPICHEISDKDFSYNKNYRKAMSLATESQRKVFAARCEEINAVKREFFMLAEDGVDYDCFICTKVRDGNDYTKDSHYAAEIYDYLKEKGYKPFYSEREIKRRTGAAYEALILYALKTSECMVIVCSDEGYLQTPWVKNEYTRFLKLIGDNEKEGDSITIAFNGQPIERLPGKHSKIQGVDLSQPRAFSLIEDYVERHTPLACEKRKREKEAKEHEAEEIRRQIDEQKQAQEALEKKLRELNTQKAEPSAIGGVSVENLLVRAKQLRDIDKKEALRYYNQALDLDPENEDAWLGIFLLDCCANDIKDLKNHGDFSKTKYYAPLMKHASDKTKKEIGDILGNELARLDRERREEEERKERARREEEARKQRENEKWLEQIRRREDEERERKYREYVAKQKKALAGAIISLSSILLIVGGLTLFLLNGGFHEFNNNIIMPLTGWLIFLAGIVISVIGYLLALFNCEDVDIECYREEDYFPLATLGLILTFMHVFHMIYVAIKVFLDRA